MSATADIGADDVFAKVAAVLFTRSRRTITAGMGAFTGRIFIGLVFFGGGHVILLIACVFNSLRIDFAQLCALTSLCQYFFIWHAADRLIKMPRISLER
ncbi:hypothetical protein V2P20_18635 [Methylobacter sp. Wu1]|uniref:hypothetical protein n=1 Tax=Methylobacter sp. Wu1 TaxID=3119359 RepID=UPI002F95FDD2